MKNILNYKMLLCIFKQISENKKLNDNLNHLLLEGFLFYEDCCFLTTLYKQQNHINKSDFIDKTGYECFINSVHIDDYVEKDLFEQVILFSIKLIELWNNQNNKLILNMILSETDFGFNLKFHVYRENERWINENEICKFEEAIIIFNTCEYDGNNVLKVSDDKKM